MYNLGCYGAAQRLPPNGHGVYGTTNAKAGHEMYKKCLQHTTYKNAFLRYAIIKLHFP